MKDMYGDWLVLGKDGGLCKACKLFVASSDVPNVYGKFLSKPWVNYSRVKDIKDHANNEYRVNAMIALSNFRSTTEGRQPTIRQQLNKQDTMEMI